MHWKTKVTDVATHILGQAHGYPVVAKELAFQAVKFATKVRSSNPLSFLLRPLFGHKHLRLHLGMFISIAALIICFWTPEFAGANTGGKIEINILPAGEIDPETIEAVRLPIQNYRISQRFWTLHPGLDLAAKTGEPINPVMAGTVVQVLHDRYAYGNHILVDHGNGFSSLYAHLSKIEVKEGDLVNTKSEIGLVGSTGHSTGPHLHLEIYQDNRPTNPSLILGIK